MSSNRVMSYAHFIPPRVLFGTLCRAYIRDELLMPEERYSIMSMVFFARSRGIDLCSRLIEIIIYGKRFRK